MSATCLMLTFEVTRRLKELEAFRETLAQYGDRVENAANLTGDLCLQEKDGAPGTRERLNNMIPQARASMALAGVDAFLTYNPQPWEVQQQPRRVGVFEGGNPFELHRSGFAFERSVDFVDQAIGAYRNALPCAKVRTYFPPFLIFFLLIWIIRAVLGSILSVFGFSAPRIQVLAASGSVLLTTITVVRAAWDLWTSLTRAGPTAP